MEEYVREFLVLDLVGMKVKNEKGVENRREGIYCEFDSKRVTLLVLFFILLISIIFVIVEYGSREVFCIMI